MLVIDHPVYFDGVVTFAKSVRLYEPDASAIDGHNYLKTALERLARFTRRSEDGEPTTRVRLYPDFAPHSFGFEVQTRSRDGDWQAVLVGGLIFHGVHDGGGNGSAPTFSVSLTPIVGWSIHT